MAACAEIAPLLFRADEGEATPEQAMRVARHLADCTACKIHLARERRLSAMLAEDLEDLPVGEEFVHSVMATLPQGPPPDGKRRKRGLKLASFTGSLGLFALCALAAQGFGAIRFSAAGLQSFDTGSIDTGLGTLLGLVRVVLVALQTVAVELPLQGPQLPGSAAVAAAVALPTLGALLAGSLALVCVAGGWLARAVRSATL